MLFVQLFVVFCHHIVWACEFMAVTDCLKTILSNMVYKVYTGVKWTEDNFAIQDDVKGNLTTKSICLYKKWWFICFITLKLFRKQCM